ncbi:MAG: nicotinic acid mononucleotide adenylyltransferase [Robiginitomaculum sp.]|nr:MAG: nicotinic acid mononucleotide adenylyltransferase [Robiginitomaculum sp.]
MWCVGMAISARNLFPPVSKGLRVGLYGGSFNPLHAGHIHVAKSAKTRLQLDAIWWLVSPGNPLKGEVGKADYEGRLTGVRQALKGLHGHYVCTAEAAMKTRYSVDLIHAVRAIRPAIRPVWVMGGDNLANFHLWKDWQRMAFSIPMAVIARPQDPVRARFSPMARFFASARLPAAAANILADQSAPAWVYLPAPMHHHSSTQMRAEPGR